MTRNIRLTRRGALKTGAIAAGVAGVGTRTGAADDNESSSDDHCYYQVDFVAGDPIDLLGESDGAFYGRQNRLIQYLHVDGDHVIERDTWINSLDPEIRRCVTAEPIRIWKGTISVEFTIADGCERTFSLAVYPLPGGEFSFDGQQEIVAAATEAFGPGTHELTVEAIRGPGCPPQPSIGYEQRAKLVADDAGEHDFFGTSVAVSESGETAVIGADYDEVADVEAGSVYVFRRADGTWTRRAKLTASNPGEYDHFGGSVAVSGSGDTAVIGADGDDTDAGEHAGSAYVFTRTDGTWTQQTNLTAADAAAGDSFGYSVAVSGSGETAFVGADGGVYVFGRTDGTWTQRANLTAADAAEGDLFGYSVAVSGPGETAVIGARSDDTDAGRNTGSAYVFSRADRTWTQQAKLVADDAATNDYFGSSVAVSGSGDTAVIGAEGDDAAGWSPEAGSAYVFSRANGTWTQQTKLTADDAGIGDTFGASVAVSGASETVVIGADGDDVGSDTGSAYVFGQ